MDLRDKKRMVQSLDYSGSILDVSPAWLDLTGYSKGEVLGRHFLEFLDVESLLRVDKNFPCLKDFGYVDNVSLTIRCKSGKTVTVTLNGTSKYSDKGEFERTFCEITPVE
ncbi:PAS domain-containing protein [Vibrio sp. HN007]|uniref:PAS domain-containing protein n=1 Tax=Vibrio iocasae TaxID=3098914 RepID=UPI0035D3E5B7